MLGIYGLYKIIHHIYISVFPFSNQDKKAQARTHTHTHTHTQSPDFLNKKNNVIFIISSITFSLIITRVISYRKKFKIFS